MNTFEKAMEWFATHQPRLRRELEGKRDRLQDFLLPARLLLRLQAGVLGATAGR